jgi:adenylate kinase family enzyme
MLHLDQKDKHLYDIKELQTIRGEKDDYFNVAIGKAQVVTTDADLFPDFGNFEKVDYETQYLDIFNNIDDTKRRNSLLKELKTSWDNYLQKRRFEMKTKSVTVIWVEGASGSGKSTFAINLAKNNNKSYVVSSSSNDVMQDYTAQDYLILDDLRDDTFTFTDLLKLLDNYVISTIKSRYNNKMFLGDTIIVTSCKPLCEWYSNSSEDKTQLYRRINMFVRCRRVDERLIADIYLPPKNTPVISSEGKPNGKPIPTPIMYLSPDLSKGVEDICASLGIDLNAAVEPLTQQVVQSDFFSSLGYSAEDLKEEDEEDLEELPLPPKKRGKNSDKIDKK